MKANKDNKRGLKKDIRFWLKWWFFCTCAFIVILWLIDAYLLGRGIADRGNLMIVWIIVSVIECIALLIIIRSDFMASAKEKM